MFDWFDDEYDDKRQGMPSHGYEVAVFGRRGSTRQIFQVENYHEVLRCIKNAARDRGAFHVRVYQYGKQVAKCSLQRIRFAQRVNEYNEGIRKGALTA